MIQPFWRLQKGRKQKDLDDIVTIAIINGSTNYTSDAIATMIDIFVSSSESNARYRGCADGWISSCV